jgi:hypothetical protein
LLLVKGAPRGLKRLMRGSIDARESKPEGWLSLGGICRGEGYFPV